MTIIQFRDLFRSTLCYQFRYSEIDYMFKSILVSFFRFKPTIIGLNPNKLLTNKQAIKLNDSLSLIKKNCPLQYVIGKAFFLDLEIFVNKDVLIPRPETEELVVWSSKYIKSNDEVIDLCTGSGCIALAIKKMNPFTHITGLDISKKAISLAKKNSKKLNIEVDWIVADITDYNEKGKKFDIIISNPPYVHPDEIPNIHERVLNYEPEFALFTPKDDPIFFYKYCINFAIKALKSGGKLFFEVNPNYCDQVENQILKKYFSNIKIKKDFRGKNRMLSATKL